MTLSTLIAQAATEQNLRFHDVALHLWPVVAQSAGGHMTVAEIARVLVTIVGVDDDRLRDAIEEGARAGLVPTQHLVAWIEDPKSAPASLHELLSTPEVEAVQEQAQIQLAMLVSFRHRSSATAASVVRALEMVLDTSTWPASVREDTITRVSAPWVVSVLLPALEWAEAESRKATRMWQR
ncbi:hypothetical protein DWB68_06250 [Galactobacter valiniphilus]|uniref:Uncharacterized protein n=1 Tax=Galactobacter valiniphilus TaxID=2676122 RepID=A0A399JAH4_9MICC|nr:hypothetical protein [Galactobacter valiniphilus]RII42548.1 hypothetical protein DWB68_06250 [Galactobacter valiniphilus]